MSAVPNRGPRAPRRGGGASRAVIATAIAVALHFVFAGLLIFSSFVQVNVPGGKRYRSPPKAVSLRPIDAQQWAQNRGQATPSDDARPSRSRPVAEKPKEKKPEKRPEGQVVDVAPGNGEASDDAKYLAESSNKVEKETRSKDQTAFYRNAMPKRSSTVPQQGAENGNADKAQIAGNNGLGDDDRPLRDANEGKATFEVPDVKGRQEIALKTDGVGPGAQVENRSESNEVVGNSDRLKIQPGAGAEGAEESSAGRKGTPGVVNLVPSMAVLDKLSGAAPNDHLKDVEEGDGTYLNTREWKYSSFFNRVKQSVGMHWDPFTQLRQRDPTLNIYGGRDRYTVVNVTLSPQGRVTDIFVEKSCGLDFLDLEAIRSFEKAQPFPNPPPGLMSGDQTVRFSFGFYLEMEGGPRMRLFRGAN